MEYITRYPKMMTECQEGTSTLLGMNVPIDVICAYIKCYQREYINLAEKMPKKVYEEFTFKKFITFKDGEFAKEKIKSHFNINV